MRTLISGCGVAFLIAVALLVQPSPAVEGEVTADWLWRAAVEPENWPTNHRAHDGSRFSGLARLDRGNVHRLVVRYTALLGGPVEGGGNFAAAQPFSPLVEGGFIYIVDGWGKIAKLDARAKGAVVWESDAGRHDLDAWLEASRGIALYRDMVIAGAADGRLHWIDAATGQITRSAQVGDPLDGYTIVAPPLVVGDRVIVGGGGAARGARGRIDALDARTGERLWTTYSIPAPGELGAESWGTAGNAWRNGGGTFVQTGVYDSETGLTIWGTGHPYPPFEPTSRPGDNLHSNSALALDVATGAIRWSFQYVPGDRFGFSEGGSHMLVAAGGRKLLTHFGNNGYFYALDAADGTFLRATPHVEGIGWTDGIDTKSGKPIEHVSGAPVQPYKSGGAWAHAPGCPNIRSSAAVAAAYSLRTGLAYGAGADGCTEKVQPNRTASNSGWLGAWYAGATNTLGSLAAIDPATGALAARRRFDFPLHSGVLATAGGLVVTTTAEGTLHILNDETLETIWSQKFGSLTPVPPITFAVDDQQFLAVVIGGNAFGRELSYRPPEMPGAEPLFVLVVLGLPS